MLYFISLLQSRKYGTGTVPGDCGAFCEDYVEVCDSANAFFDGGPRGGDPGSRRLIEGDEPTLVRLGDSTFGAVDDCLKACAGYPRPYDPSTFKAIESPAGGSLDSNSIGDTFWCRQTHLQVAKAAGDAFAAQVHCPAASPSGGGKCVNQGLGWNWSGDDPLTNPLTESPLNNLNATAWELIRNGADTGRHLGYCQLYFNDVVADCTNAGIDNAAFTVALGLLPLSVEVIILSNNVGKSTSSIATAGEGLTTIADNAFKSLFCPTCIRSVIIDQGNLATLSAGSFSGLTYLEQLSLNMQPIAALPTGMLDELLYLREFTVYNNNGQPGRLTDAGVPAALIYNNQFLERFVISGHPSLKNLPSTFFGNSDPMDLSIMQSIDLSNNGLIDGGFLPGTLNNMGQLEYLDLSQNDFQTAPAGWIVPSMRKLRRFSLYDNPIMTFSGDFFVNAVSLEVALLHDLTKIAPALGLFSNSPNLISYTISETAPSNP